MLDGIVVVVGAVVGPVVVWGVVVTGGSVVDGVVEMR